MIALAEDNLIAPALHENLPRDTDAVLVDESGRIIYPPDRARAADGSGWAEAIAAAARGASGTLTAEAERAAHAVRVLACARGDAVRGRVRAARGGR